MLGALQGSFLLLDFLIICAIIIKILNSKINCSMVQSLSQTVLQQFLENMTFTDFGSINNYTLQYSIEEASENFLRTKMPAGKCICNNNEVYFVDERLLSAEHMGLFSRVPKRKTDIPDIYMLLTDPVKALPIKLVISVEDMDYPS
jgi:hypothetical protein